MNELIYHKYQTFQVIDQTINIISEEFDTHFSTVAEINNTFHHLGNEQPNVSAAIFAYQEVFKQELTSEQLKQVLLINNITSQAV